MPRGSRDAGVGVFGQASGANAAGSGQANSSANLASSQTGKPRNYGI